MDAEEIRRTLVRTSEGYEWICPECGEKLEDESKRLIVGRARIHYYSEHQMERESE